MGTGAAALAGGVLLTLLAGCRGVPHAGPYTQDELKAICERQGGWWHPDDLLGGLCEYQAPGMVRLEISPRERPDPA